MDKDELFVVSSSFCKIIEFEYLEEIYVIGIVEDKFLISD